MYIYYFLFSDRNEADHEGKPNTCTTNRKESDNTEKENIDNELSWRCFVCNVAFRTKQMLVSHNDEIHRITEIDFQEGVKRKMSSEVSDIPNSKKLRMDEEKDLKGGCEESEDQRHWKCLQCGKTYVHKSSAKIHLKTEHNISLAKSPIYITEATAKDVADYLEKEKRGFLFRCKKCKREYTLKSSVVRHLKTDHHVGMKNVQKFIENLFSRVDQTNEEAPTEEQMQARKISSEKMWKCKICGDEFSDCKSTEQHMSTAHEMRISKSRAYIEAPLSDDDINKCHGYDDGGNFDDNGDESEEWGPPNISQQMPTEAYTGNTGSCNTAGRGISYRRGRVKRWECIKCGNKFCQKKDVIKHLLILHNVIGQKRDGFVKKLNLSENMPELEKEKSATLDNSNCLKCNSKCTCKPDVQKYLHQCDGIVDNKAVNEISTFEIKNNEMQSEEEVIAIDSSDEEGSNGAEESVVDPAKEVTQWGCQKCRKKFTKRGRVRDHMRLYHNLHVNEAEDRGILIQSCNGQEVRWKDEEETTTEDVEVLERKPQKEWFCKLCSKSYFRRLDGARHCKGAHNVSYEEGKLLVVHVSKMAEKIESNIEEKTCKEEVNDDEVGEQQPWKCIKCSKQFSNKPEIQRHLTDFHFIADQDHEFFMERNKDNIRKWMCSKCGQRFFHRFDTSRHVNLIHDIIWEKAKDFVQFIDDCNSSFLEHQDPEDTKPYVCLICHKLFCAKKQLMNHLQKFHKAKLDAANFGKHVLSFRKLHFRNWDCVSPEDVDSKSCVPLSMLASYMVEEDTEAEREDSFNLSDIEVRTLNGEGSNTEETWAKIIGTSYESACNKSTSYRPKKDMENKRFSCMLCNLRYYKMKEAQRHMFLKHEISYIEAVNYINENKDIAFNQDLEGPSERTPKRRKVREDHKHLFYCTTCMKAAIHFQSSQHHVTQYHKEKKENVCRKICRSQNVDVFRLGNEDKMNFVCVLCCVTFRGRIDGFKHIAKEHPQVFEDEISEFLFTKEDKMKTCVVKFDRTIGVTKVFSVQTEAIWNDVKFSEVNTIKEEGSDSEEEKKKTSKTEKEEAKDDFREYENVEDSLAILLMNMSNPENFQKFTYNEFYYIFSIPAKSQKSMPFNAVNNITCPNCPREFINEHSLRKHLLSCCVPKQNTWECLNCRKNFKSVGSLVNHIQKRYQIQGMDVLDLMHSREILIAPENGMEIMVDGRSDLDVTTLFHSRKSNVNDEENSDNDEVIHNTSEGDTRKQCFVCGCKCTDRKTLFKHCEEVHFITGHNNRFTECLQCMLYFKSRKDIMDHLQKVHGIKCPKLNIKSHMCVICEEKFSDNVQLAKHVRIHGTRFSCKHCSKRFESYSKMATHLRIHFEKFPRKPMNCSICNMSVPGESFMGHLIAHYDRKFGPWKCCVCEKEFQLRRNLKEHLKGEHQTLICEKCGKTFNCLFTLKRHEAVHKNQVKCSMCNKDFDNKIELAIHKRIHVRFWICNICGRNLPNQPALNSHIKAHKEKRALTTAQKSEKSCQICNRNFSSYEMYQKHQAMHKGGSFHSCQYCGKKYSYLGSLKLHFRTNHPEHKPYKCVVCGKTFSTYHQRFLHMREHKDYADPIRPFRCSFCPARFKHKMSLQRHERLKHFNESLTGFSCEKCNKEFTSGQSLLRHAMFCEPMHNEHKSGGGEQVSVIVENDSTELEVVAEETVAENVNVRYEVEERGGEAQGVQIHTINIGSEVLSFSCGDQEELILEVPEGMLVETDNGYQIIVSEAN